MLKLGDGPCKHGADSPKPPEPEHVDYFKPKSGAMIGEQKADRL